MPRELGAGFDDHTLADIGLTATDICDPLKEIERLRSRF